jgi:hypothetical protein
MKMKLGADLMSSCFLLKVMKISGRRSFVNENETSYGSYRELFLVGAVVLQVVVLMRNRTRLNGYINRTCLHYECLIELERERELERYLGLGDYTIEI